MRSVPCLSLRAGSCHTARIGLTLSTAAALLALAPMISTTVASMLPVWFSPRHVWEGRSVDVCCGLVGLAGGVGTRVGGAQGADRTCVRQGRSTGDRRSLSRRLAVRGYAQNRLASGRAGGSGAALPHAVAAGAQPLGC